MKQKNKPKHKKKSVSKETNTKSVFLYGKPNVEKGKLLIKQQTLYTNALNSYIDFLYNIDNYDIETFIEILNNQTKSSLLRKIEKTLRSETTLKSAFSQEAFDEAVNKVSTQFLNIRNEMYSINKNDFVSSKMLYAMSIYGYSKDDMISKISDYKEKKETLLSQENEKNKKNKLKKDIEYYSNLIDLLSNMTNDEFLFNMNEFCVWYQVITDSYKQPFCKKAFVKMSSSTCKLEEANQVKYPFVILITSPDSNTRIEVPLKTSKRTISRMNRYKVGTSMAYTIRDDGSIRVNAYIEKKVEIEKSTPIYIGVDTGITDSFHTSNGFKIGGSVEIEKFYKNEVEPSLAELNKLKQKKKKLKKYLHKHKKDLSDIQIKQFRDKMDHIENNIRKNKKSKKLRNKYHNMNDQLIGNSCKEYIKLLNGNKQIVTVLEMLDIKEFNKSKHENSLHSLFVRGKLQKRLMEQLNWNGYQFTEVEPAFTSQVCPICGNLDSKNRNNKNFKCTCCGYEDDADHVGAVNIKSRVEDEEILNICEDYKYQKAERHKQLKILYKKRNQEYIKKQTSFCA